MTKPCGWDKLEPGPEGRIVTCTLPIDHIGPHVFRPLHETPPRQTCNAHFEAPTINSSGNYECTHCTRPWGHSGPHKHHHLKVTFKVDGICDQHGNRLVGVATLQRDQKYTCLAHMIDGSLACVELYMQLKDLDIAATPLKVSPQ